MANDLAGVCSQVLGDTVLDRPRGVHEVQLRVQSHVGVGADVGHLHQRREADGVHDRGIAAPVPRSTAVGMRTQGVGLGAGRPFCRRHDVVASLVSRLADV